MTKKELKELFDQIVKDEFPELKERHVILILHDENNKSEFWPYPFIDLAACTRNRRGLKNIYIDPIVFVHSCALAVFDKNCLKEIIRHELLHLAMNTGDYLEFWEECDKRNIKKTLDDCIENNKIYLNIEMLKNRFYPPF